MPVPSSITDLSTTAASNSPAGSDPISTNLDDYLRAYQAIVRAESLNKGWERYNHTATWLSATTFSVPGDLTALYATGRRLRATLAGPTTAYSTITGSVFGGGATTVTVVNDSTDLSSPISEVQLGADVLSLFKSGEYLFNGAKATTQPITDSSDKLSSTGFVQSVAALVGGAVGDMRNGRMSIASAGVSGTFTADELVVAASLGGTCYRLGNYSEAINLSTTGAGGMDTGSAPVSGFVSLYAIYNPSTAAKSILACNVATSSGSVYGGSDMPAGYTASALIGVWPTNASSQFKAGFQRNRSLSFVPVEVYNANSSVPTSLTTLSIASVIPPNAVVASGSAGSPSTDSAAISIASDANGIGQQTIVVSLIGAIFDSFVAAAAWSVPIVTAQNIFFKARVSTQNTRITVNGYSF